MPKSLSNKIGVIHFYRDGGEASAAALEFLVPEQSASPELQALCRQRQLDDDGPPTAQ